MPPSTPVTAGTPGPAVAGAKRRRDRALLRDFFWREISTRYLGSITGLAWALLHPLALLGVYHFVFTTVFRASGFQGHSFLLFVAVVGAGRGKRSRARLEAPLWFVDTLHDRLIVRVETYADSAEALEAAGLEE